MGTHKPMAQTLAALRSTRYNALPDEEEALEEVSLQLTTPQPPTLALETASASCSDPVAVVQEQLSDREVDAQHASWLEYSASLTAQASLMTDVCRALEPTELPSSNELLQELYAALHLAQNDLETKMTSTHDEEELVRCLGLHEAIAEAVRVYESLEARRHAEVEEQCQALKQAEEVVQREGTEKELLEMLGGEQVAPRPQVQLVKTKSEEEFESFFASRATENGTVFGSEAQAVH